MAHYQRAQGQPCCKFGAQCTRKQPGHWESYDHPHDHPRIVNAKKHIKQQDGPTLDRSRCALAGREGDEPNSAIYTCAGCGTKVEGFSRWRNHMKRAKRVGSSSVAPSGGQAAGKQASSTGSAIQSMAAHHEHEPAWAVTSDTPDNLNQPVPSKPLKAVAPTEQQQPKALMGKAEGKAVWRLSGKEKRAMADAAASATHTMGTATAATAAAPTTGQAARERVQKSARGSEQGSQAATSSGDAPLGKRWLPVPGKDGKRQRKFF